jgi:hypothetical protein
MTGVAFRENIWGGQALVPLTQASALALNKLPLMDENKVDFRPEHIPVYYRL